MGWGKTERVSGRHDSLAQCGASPSERLRKGVGDKPIENPRRLICQIFWFGAYVNWGGSRCRIDVRLLRWDRFLLHPVHWTVCCVSQEAIRQRNLNRERRTNDEDQRSDCISRRSLLCSATADAQVTFDWATVGNPGNAPDQDYLWSGPIRRGRRHLPHQQARGHERPVHRVSECRRPTGTNPNSVYNINMGLDGSGGIAFNAGAARSPVFPQDQHG